MRRKHKGIRPTGILTILNFKKNWYHEELPDGTDRIWTERQLRSGCGKTTETDHYETMRGCSYCPTCDEYFSDEQWESV